MSDGSIFKFKILLVPYNIDENICNGLNCVTCEQGFKVNLSLAPITNHRETNWPEARPLKSAQKPNQTGTLRLMGLCNGCNLSIPHWRKKWVSGFCWFARRTKLESFWIGIHNATLFHWDQCPNYRSVAQYSDLASSLTNMHKKFCTSFYSELEISPGIMLTQVELDVSPLRTSRFVTLYQMDLTFSI